MVLIFLGGVSSYLFLFAMTIHPWRVVLETNALVFLWQLVALRKIQNEISKKDKVPDAGFKM